MRPLISRVLLLLVLTLPLAGSCAGQAAMRAPAPPPPDDETLEFRGDDVTLRIGPLQGERSLSQDQAGAALHCYQLAPRGTEGPGGALHLRLAWRDGSLRVITAAEQTQLSQPFRDCVETAAREWQFRPPTTGSEDEVIPLEFVPPIPTEVE